MTIYNPPFLCFDIGGTKMRVSQSLDGKTLGPPSIVPTPGRFDEAKKLLNDTVTSMRPFSAAVGGVPGSLDQTRQSIHVAPNLPDWSGKAVAREFASVLNCPVLIENDAALVGLGEATKGAGKDFTNVVYITVSTGVNGVKVINGRIEQNIHGAEIGHQIINFDVQSHFNQFGRGELEDYVGGASIEKREGKLPWEITDTHYWSEVARHLSVGLHNTILHWSPQVVVIGGSVAGKIPLEQLQESLKSSLSIFPEIPKIRRSELGDLGGLYGALAYINSLQA